MAVNLQRYRGLVNIQFSKILELISRPEVVRDHESGLRSDRGPVVLRDFFQVAILETTIRFFKFVWEILPIQPTIHTQGKNLHPPFFSEI